MLKATLLRTDETGVSYLYKVTGPTTEMNQFIAWNMTQVAANGEIKKRKYPDVLSVYINITDYETGKLIGKRKKAFSGTVVPLQKLAGENIGKLYYEFVPSAYEQAVDSSLEKDGDDDTTTLQERLQRAQFLINNGIINKEELEGASDSLKGNIVINELPKLETLSLVPNLTGEGDKAEASSVEPKTENVKTK
jgi:hypothetical protein